MLTNKIFTAFFIAILFFHWSTAQEVLPKGLTDHEQLILDKGEYTPYSTPSLSPPPGPVRVPAEWEEMDAVIIVWESFSSILAQITEALKSEVEVIIVCPNVNSTKTYLTNQGIDWSENVSFYALPSNSLWVRDYGPNSAYIEETGEMVWIDWIYNRPRYQDDQVPQSLGAERGITVYETASAPEDLVNTGGNFMSDGMGKSFSSDLVLDENGANNQFGTSNHSEEDVDAIMNQYMGISEYIKMEALPYDLIHHIDMHMKIIDEETILVGEYPEGIADGPQIEANIQYVLDQFVTSYGRPFNIVRIPMPPGKFGQYPNTGDDYRTYANALFANKTIIVPTYEEEFDSTALRIWSEIMPGYNVVGIDCNAIIPLSGALHCITKEVAATNPLTVNMQTYPTWCSGEAIQLEATVTAYEAHSVSLHYRIGLTGDWTVENLSLSSDDNYKFEVPAQAEGEFLQYFFRVEAESGKVIDRPLPGAEGPRTTKIENCSVDTNEEFTLENTSIFPNPASAITCIAPSFASGRSISIELVDIQGKQILDIHSGEIVSQDKKFFFDATSLANGTYFVKFSSDNFVEMKKVVVLH